MGVRAAEPRGRARTTTGVWPGLCGRGIISLCLQVWMLDCPYRCIMENLSPSDRITEVIPRYLPHEVKEVDGTHNSHWVHLTYPNLAGYQRLSRGLVPKLNRMLGHWFTSFTSIQPYGSSFMCTKGRTEAWHWATGLYRSTSPIAHRSCAPRVEQRPDIELVHQG